jgi:DNA-binding NarL/FixJ family response regulator
MTTTQNPAARLGRVAADDLPGIVEAVCHFLDEHGYLLKDAPLDDLEREARRATQGGNAVDPTVFGLLDGGADEFPLPLNLTRREREILTLLADGRRDKQIAALLSISPLTVRRHVRNVMDKLEAETRTEAVARALRTSLIR